MHSQHLIIFLQVVVLLAVLLRKGPRGPRGPRGPQGYPGPTGMTGAPGRDADDIISQ